METKGVSDGGIEGSIGFGLKNTINLGKKNERKHALKVAKPRLLTA